MLISFLSCCFPYFSPIKPSFAARGRGQVRGAGGGDSGSIDGEQ